jgi:DNA-binding CsgD family transcriptional regulator
VAQPTGASAKQVAYVLSITPKTAATHIERIYINDRCFDAR